MSSETHEILAWLLRAAIPSVPVGVAFAFVSNYAIFHFLFRSKTGRQWFSKRRLHEHVHSNEQIKSEIFHALIPESVLNILTLLVLNSDKPSPIHSWFRLRWTFAWSEAPRILMECVVVFFAYEVYYYFLHVLIHNRKLFKYFHQRHHASIYPTPQTGTSVNLLEAASFYAFFFTMIFCPLHVVSVVLISLNIKLASLTQHMGHEIFPNWWRRSKILRYFNSTMWHQLHHSSKFNRNYGFQTSFLDRWFKTVDPVYTRYEDAAKASAGPASSA
jgi:Delta7-sterol 5-desaturase